MQFSRIFAQLKPLRISTQNRIKTKKPLKNLTQINAIERIGIASTHEQVYSKLTLTNLYNILILRL